MALDYRMIEIFTREQARWQGKPLYEAIVQKVSGLRIAARCLVTRGLAGCYEDGEVAAQKIMALSFDMPIKIEIVLPAPELDRLLPLLEEMVEDGVVLVSGKEAHFHRTRQRLLPRHLLVRDAMTASPRAVRVETSVDQVLRLLLSEDFHGVPVVDGKNRPVGIITQSDLIRRAGLPVRLGLFALLEQGEADEYIASLAQKKAGEVMSQPVVSVSEDQPLVEVVDLMLEQRLKRLPVVDGEGRLVGMLARVDVFRVVSGRSVERKALAEHNVVVTHVRLVGEIMDRDTRTVHPDAPIQEVVQRISEGEHQRLPVVDGEGRFLGLIFDRDLLSILSDRGVGLWKLLASKLSFTEAGRRQKSLVDQARARTAEEIMRRDLFTVREDTPIDEAVRLMVEKRLKRLPVVDEEGRFQGMVSRDALLRCGVGK